jgi:hypothetical protein
MLFVKIMIIANIVDSLRKVCFAKNIENLLVQLVGPTSN